MVHHIAVLYIADLYIALQTCFECPWKDLELPLLKQPKRLQTKVIDYFDAFMSYKNKRTKAACTENAMQLMFQVSLSYYEMLFTDPRNLRLTEADSGRVASIFWIFTLVVKVVGIVSSGKTLILFGHLILILFRILNLAVSTITGLMIAYDINEKLTQGVRPSILKVFAFSCRIVFRLIFFTFGNLTILVFFLNDQRIDKWRTILLGDNAAIVAGILLFWLNFIGLMVINASGEYLSLLVMNWKSFWMKDKSWKLKCDQFWKCMPFKLVMPFETEFLFVQSHKNEFSFIMMSWVQYLYEYNHGYRQVRTDLVWATIKLLKGPIVQPKILPCSIYPSRCSNLFTLWLFYFRHVFDSWKLWLFRYVYKL